MVYFFSAFFAALFLTWIVKILMKRIGVVDAPKNSERKVHKNKIPLSGGLAIFLSFLLVSLFALYQGAFSFLDVSKKEFMVLFLGGAILMVGGFLDDKYDLKPKFQIIFPLLAALLTLFFGLGRERDIFSLSFESGVWVTDMIVFFWLLSLMYTTKFLDGLDGLVTGIVGIGALALFFLCTQEQWYQPEAALLSLIFIGAGAGFLVWNWHPAKIFLGEGGSLFAGFALGVLAIIAGGKIATTLLIVGLPFFDLFRVVWRRLRDGRSVYLGDSEHMHYRLLSTGLSHRQVVLLFYAVSFLFGFSTLFLQSKQKLVALLFLGVLMLLLGFLLSGKKYERK